MPRGRWKQSDEALSAECFSVFFEKYKPSRLVTRQALMEALRGATVRSDFLKLCLEYDDTEDLRRFREGLLVVVKAMGVSQVSRLSKIDRVHLYRMLKSSGNPSFTSIASLCRALGVRLWLVDQDFMARRTRHVRPRDELRAEPWATPRPRGYLSPGGRRVLVQRPRDE